jgi:hypothetical protein
MEERRDAYRVSAGKPLGKMPLGTQGIHRKIILKWFFRKSVGRRGWIDLARGSDRYVDVVKAAMKLGVP